MRFWPLILAICWSKVAAAGPWLEPANQGFVALSQTLGLSSIDLTLNNYRDVYLQYGRDAQSTVVISAGVEGKADLRGHFSVRRAIDAGHTHLKFAYEVGLGATSSLSNEDQIDPLLRLGLSAGRGFPIKKQNGWATVDAEMVLQPAGPPTVKFDGTFGLSTPKDWKWMLHGTVELVNKEWHAKFGPSVAIPYLKNRHLQVGAHYSTNPETQFGAKLSLWQSF